MTSRRSRAPRRKRRCSPRPKRVLPPQPLPFDADFFTDLGGHSLLAARFVSVIRETPRLQSITLQDVYAARTLRAIGGLLDGKLAVAAPMQDLSFRTSAADAPFPLRSRASSGAALHHGAA